MADSDENDYGSEFDSDLTIAMSLTVTNLIMIKGKTLGKRTCKTPNLKPKRLQVYSNISYRPVKEFVQIQYIGEIEPQLSNETPNFEISHVPPQFFAPSKEWENEPYFRPTKLQNYRLADLIYAIEANIETNSQITKINHKNSLSNLRTQ